MAIGIFGQDDDEDEVKFDPMNPYGSPLAPKPPVDPTQPPMQQGQRPYQGPPTQPWWEQQKKPQVPMAAGGPMPQVPPPTQPGPPGVVPPQGPAPLPPMSPGVSMMPAGQPAPLLPHNPMSNRPTGAERRILRPEPEPIDQGPTGTYEEWKARNAAAAAAQQEQEDREEYERLNDPAKMAAWSKKRAQEMEANLERSSPRDVVGTTPDGNTRFADGSSTMVYTPKTKELSDAAKANFKPGLQPGDTPIENKKGWKVDPVTGRITRPAGDGANTLTYDPETGGTTTTLVAPAHKPDPEIAELMRKHGIKGKGNLGPNVYSPEILEAQRKGITPPPFNRRPGQIIEDPNKVQSVPTTEAPKAKDYWRKKLREKMFNDEFEYMPTDEEKEAYAEQEAEFEYNHPGNMALRIPPWAKKKKYGPVPR